jgi:LPS sulfotransferase NodH
MNTRKFVIVAEPRTGSTFLHLLLASHPNVVVYGEIFHPVDQVRESITTGFQLPRLQLSDDPVEYLKNVYSQQPETAQAVGFKLFYTHARNSEWSHLREYLKSANVKVIHLKRKNLLDRYLSHQLADRSNEWVVYKKHGAATEPIRLDPPACIKDFQRSVWFQQQEDEFFKDNPFLEIVYEEFVANLAGESAKLLSFLEVELRDLTPKTMKQRTEKKSKIIANFDELKEQLIQSVREGWAREEWLDFFKEE